MDKKLENRDKPLYESIKIDKKWIEENIEKPGWQRNLYPSRVNYFLNCIKQGTFRKSLLTLARNRKNGRFVLLDGQHKIEAIRQYGKPIEMDLSVYHNIDEEEMIEIYEMLNNVKPQRIIDDIKVYVGRNSYLDYFLDKRYFPINITLSGGANSLRLDKFLAILFNGQKSYIGRKPLNRKNIKSFIEGLDGKQAEIAKEFYEFYRSTYGMPSVKNWVYGTTFSFIIMRIWLKNKGKFSRDEMVKIFRPIESDGLIRQQAVRNDLLGIDELTRKIYRFINKGRSVNQFDVFWEEDLKTPSQNELPT